jgi:hypothetical protein
MFSVCDVHLQFSSAFYRVLVHFYNDFLLKAFGGDMCIEGVCSKQQVVVINCKLTFYSGISLGFVEQWQMSQVGFNE